MFGGLAKIDAGCWRRRELAPAPPPLYFPATPRYSPVGFLYFFCDLQIHLCCNFGFGCVWFGFGQEYLFRRWKLNDLLFQRLTDHSNSTPQSSTYSWSRELESEINFTCWISQDFTQVKITIDCKNMTFGWLMMTKFANFCMCSCRVSCLTIINKII